jgi:hypothetical protein
MTGQDVPSELRAQGLVTLTGIFGYCHQAAPSLASKTLGTDQLLIDPQTGAVKAYDLGIVAGARTQIRGLAGHRHIYVPYQNLSYMEVSPGDSLRNLAELTKQWLEPGLRFRQLREVIERALDVPPRGQGDCLVLRNALIASGIPATRQQLRDYAASLAQRQSAEDPSEEVTRVCAEPLALPEWPQ